MKSIRLLTIGAALLTCLGCARIGFDPFPVVRLCDDIECNDHNPCTVDVCIEGSGCQFAPAAGTCDDGDSCTLGDQCAAGVCVGGGQSPACSMSGYTNVGLVADINRNTNANGGATFVAVGSNTLFVSRGPEFGSELWETDGTPGGTRLFLDLQAGPASGMQSVLYAFGSAHLFLADDGTTGTELWITDGSLSGTRLVRDIEPGPGDSSPLIPQVDAADYRLFAGRSGHTVVLNGSLYFVATTTALGKRVWKTDGTEAGTVPIVPSSGEDYTSPGIWGATTTSVFFSARTPTTGTEVWTTDGTPAGTGMVVDLRSGTGAGVSPFVPSVMSGVAIFSGNDGSGSMIWRSDGTATGTFSLKASSAFTATKFNDKLYFAASSVGEGTEPWSTDGTVGGTVLFADLVTGPTGSAPTFAAGADGRLYIYADEGGDVFSLWTYGAGSAEPVRIGPISEGERFLIMRGALELTDARLYVRTTVAAGTELWSHDDQGHRMLADIFPGPESGLIYRGELVEYQGQAIFSAAGDVLGNEAWITDGTVLGTRVLRDILPGPYGSSYASSFSIADGRFYLFADAGTHGYEPWVTDATETGTIPLGDLDTSAASSWAWGLTATPSGLYFVANDGQMGTELWKTDGTSAGTVIASDLAPGSQSGGISDVALLGDTLLMVGDPGSMPGLYAYDPVGGMTLLKASVSPDYVGNFMPFAGKIYFVGALDASGIELWRTDGSSAGTVRVQDTNPGAGDGFDYGVYFGTAGAYLYFHRLRGEHEPWVSDGTDAGTGVLKDINPGGHSYSWGYLGVGSRMFFQADDGVHGRELWTSEGTAASTVLVKDIAADAAHSEAEPLADVNGRLLFRISGAVQGELWISDGTDAGTFALALWEQVDPCNDCIGGRDGWLYLAGDDGGGAGDELWRTDGVTLELVDDVIPGSDGSRPRNLTSADGWLYFAADDGVHGRELWRTLGLPGTSEMVDDINPGVEGSDPDDITLFEDRVYFTAFTPGIGRELWVVSK